MSSDGRYHTSRCHVDRTIGHTNGKWCWTEDDVQSLERQYAERRTWSQMAETFKFYDAKGKLTCYRHHSIACQAKMNALLLSASGGTNSKKLASLAKRPRAAKKPVNQSTNPPKKHEAVDVKKEHSDQDDATDKEAEEAIRKVVVKLELYLD